MMQCEDWAFKMHTDDSYNHDLEKCLTKVDTPHEGLDCGKSAMLGCSRFVPS